MSETAPDIIPAQHLYEVHKTDVQAAHELGGLAVSGMVESDLELSKRSKYLLERADGDVIAAAGQAKLDLRRNDAKSGQIVTDNLDAYIPDAKEDMIVDHLVREDPYLRDKHSVYKGRRERGVPIGEQEPDESDWPTSPKRAGAQRAIDPRSGQHSSSGIHRAI